MLRAAMSAREDFLAPFQLDSAPLRGRYVRLGAGVIDPILRRHAYPRPVALLLGEALALCALAASLVKQYASLTIQAQGDGVAPLLVAEA
ncbi:MAG: Hsp33 family molecular chaperone HslO, partial [Hyphomonadaceae bacterium]|nr:Hsp33 family molecular chaperone HslO [Hyphomonadaceae bacterium]